MMDDKVHDPQTGMSLRFVKQWDATRDQIPTFVDAQAYKLMLLKQAQQAQAEAWKLSKSDAQFLKAIKIATW
jgi:hypothetical protein